MKKSILLPVVGIIFLISGCKNTDNTTGSNSLPTIIAVSPSQVDPGANQIEGRITGTNFSGIVSVDLGNGIHVERFSLISATDIYIIFSADRSASPGPHKVVVVTATGVATSDSVFRVGDNPLPEAKFTISPQRGLRDEEFKFDGSSSSDNGAIINYVWNFGDGRSASGKIVKHQYSKGGSFKVLLTVTDDRNAVEDAEQFVEVLASQPPKARISVSPSSGTVATDFEFDASNSSDPDGTVKKFSWTFGDGQSANGKTVKHKFPIQGIWNVTLTVTDDSGEPGYAFGTVSVGEAPPSPPPPPGGGGGQCTVPAPDRGLIFGTVIGVEGPNAIVQFDSGSTCANTYYHCGDMRKANPENFYGIIKSMTDRGNGVFSIFNDCPFRWPPKIGEQVFLIYKTCAQNFCP